MKINYSVSLWTASDYASNNAAIQVYRLKASFQEYQTTRTISATGVNWHGVGASGTNQTDYTYTGQYSYTNDFGLMFYNVRWYDPSLGRFAQADTIVPSGSQGLDRYAYGLNNPSKYTDPLWAHPRRLLRHDLLRRKQFRFIA